MNKMSFACVCILAGSLCLTASAQSHKAKAPSGTVVDKKHADGSTEVQPEFKKIRVTPDVVEAAQNKLNADGYDAGKADGKLGAKTRAAIRKYQQDKSLTVNGQLDESTLSHLNVGGGKTMATAPSDIGHGAKAAGHDIKEGHPIAAAKAFGKGFGHAGKAVAEGTKSGVVGSKDKVAGKDKPEDKQPPR